MFTLLIKLDIKGGLELYRGGELHFVGRMDFDVALRFIFLHTVYIFNIKLQFGPTVNS